MHFQRVLEGVRLRALYHLGQATHDKGGHRVKALEHVRAAINQVEAGIRFDRRN